jgi:hypothetical protein
MIWELNVRNNCLLQGDIPSIHLENWRKTQSTSVRIVAPQSLVEIPMFYVENLTDQFPQFNYFFKYNFKSLFISIYTYIADCIGVFVTRSVSF